MAMITPTDARHDVRRWSLLVTRQLPEQVMTQLESAFDVTLIGESRPPTREQILSSAEGNDALLITANTAVDSVFLQQLPQCVQALATYSVGYDHIDVDAARERGLAVLYTPGVLADSVAEVALLLLLGAARRATESIDLIRNRRWPGWSPVQLNGVELAGKALGIFGMGRIGCAIASRARAFGMTIHYHNRSRLSPDLEAGAVFHARAEELLAVSDALMLACPATPDTQGFLNEKRISQLKPGAMVVNVSRGNVVNDDALIAALRQGRIFAVGLDVFAGEPEVDPRYFDLPNVFMLPHIGSSTIDARLRMGQILIDGLLALKEGRGASNRIA